LPPKRAFEATLGSSDRLRPLLERFLEAEERENARIPYRAPDPPQPKATALDPAEVHLLWARTRDLPWNATPDHPALIAIGRDIARAVELAPDRPDVYLYRGQWRIASGDRLRGTADLEQAQRMAPEDPQVMLALAEARMESNVAGNRQRLNQLVRLLLRHAKTARQWNFVARYLVEQRRTRSALRFAQRAVSADPSCFRCYDTLARVHQALDELELAARAQRLAINLLPRSMLGSEAAREMEDRLRAIEAALAQP
jgi:tetratricopeptide (TPR) repeat protein